MLNNMIYSFSLWLDNSSWSTQLHESFYMYNWIESTHVLSLMLSLGILFVIDLRLLGLSFSSISIETITNRLTTPMLFGFGITIITGLLLFYAIPVRTSQSIWFRFKVLFLIAAAINALLVHYKMKRIDNTADKKTPSILKAGAVVSLLFWSLIVITGRFIAYDWFDCSKQPSELISTFAGCINDQSIF